MSSAGHRPSRVPGFSQGRLVIVLGVLVVAVLLASLDVTIVTTALPTIAGRFKAFESIPWVTSAYIVTSTIATPVLGKLSDLYGRRRVFQATMAMFFIGSLLCGIARSMGQLIAFRAVQGLGGGGIQALAFTILGDILPPRQRGRYIGYFTIAFAAAAIGGPLVGGTIVDHWDWHWIFLVNLPLVAASAIATHFALRLPFTRRQTSIDWLGAALLAGALASLLFGLEAGRTGWARGMVVAYFVAAGVLLVSFVAQERRAVEPMIPMRLFANRAVVGSCVLGLFASSVAQGMAAFLPLYFQDALFVRPTAAGLRVVPLMIGVVAMTFATGRLIARTGRYKVFPIVGTMAMSAGLLLIAQITGTTPYAYLVAPMLILGFGSGSTFTTTSIALQNACEMRDLGIATATMMFFRSLGASIGAAGYGTLLNSTIRASLPAKVGLAPADALKLIRAPSQIKALDPARRQSVIDSIAHGVSRIYWVGGLAMIVAVVWAISVPELPLRDKAGISDALAEAAAS